MKIHCNLYYMVVPDNPRQTYHGVSHNWEIPAAEHVPRVGDCITLGDLELWVHRVQWDPNLRSPQIFLAPKEEHQSELAMVTQSHHTVLHAAVEKTFGKLATLIRPEFPDD